MTPAALEAIRERLALGKYAPKTAQPIVDDAKALLSHIDALRKALARAITYIELVYEDEAGEEAAAAKHDLDLARRALGDQPWRPWRPAMTDIIQTPDGKWWWYDTEKQRWRGPFKSRAAAVRDMKRTRP
jgi:hypothetical protein